MEVKLTHKLSTLCLQYLVAVVIIVILEIVAGILGFVFREQVVSCVCVYVCVCVCACASQESSSLKCKSVLKGSPLMHKYLQNEQVGNIATGALSKYRLENDTDFDRVTNVAVDTIQIDVSSH